MDKLQFLVLIIIIRCSPSVDHSCLQAFDSMLRAAIQRIANSDLSESQRLQASLPLCQTRMAAWGLDVLFRLHYLLF